MKVHANAALGPAGRLALVQAIESGMTQKAAAAAFCVAPATAHRWWHRWKAAGEEERRSRSWVLDRSSRPHRQPRRLGAAEEEPILRARRQTGLGPGRLAGLCRRPRSTIWKVLHRHGLSRRPRGERQTFRRYEWSRPGALLHMDVKRLARFAEPGHAATGDRHDRNRGAGWEYLHVAIDDRSRLAYTQLLPSERKEDATAFLKSSLAWFKQHGVTVERVMTDNGAAYKSFAFRDALQAHGVQHKRTRPYTPRTNGKAERFIQSSIREWAYAQPFQSSAERAKAMHPWLHDYNTARPHAALGGKPPISRLKGDNLLGRDI